MEIFVREYGDEVTKYTLAEALKEWYSEYDSDRYEILGMSYKPYTEFALQFSDQEYSYTRYTVEIIFTKLNK